MVNVKLHECFPTIISEFSYHPDVLTENHMKKYIIYSKEQQLISHRVEDNLHIMSYFSKLRNVILEANKTQLK